MPPKKKVRTSRAQTRGRMQTRPESSDVQVQPDMSTREDVNLDTKVAGLTKNASSKAQALPANVLSRIFLIASHSGPMDEAIQTDLLFFVPQLVRGNKTQFLRNDTVFALPNMDAEPCKLTRVCKSWRCVALSTPSLWSHIVITLSVLYREEDLRMLSTWLKLSRDAPLFLFLTIGELNLKDFGLELDGSLQAVLPSNLLATMSRWEILHLSPMGAPLFKPKRVVKNLLRTILSDVLPSKTGNLKRLYIHGSNGDSQALTTFSLSGFPMLEYLDGPVELVAEKGALYRLRSLQGEMRYSHCLALISHLPELAELDVELHNYNEEEEDIDEYSTFPRCTTLPGYSKPAKKPIARPTVQKIALKGEAGAITDFLAYISFPSVRSATFDLSEPPDHWFTGRSCGDPDQITDFLKYCSSTLTSLHFTSAATEDHFVIRGLEKANKLTELVLDLATLSDDGLRSLALPFENNSALINSRSYPNLTSLTIGAQKPSCVYREPSTTTWLALKYLPESKLPKPRFPVEQLVRTIQSHLTQNEHIAIRLKLQCYSEDIKKVENNSELKELQQRYKAFKLEIEDNGEKDFSNWDKLGDSEYDDNEDDDDDDFRFGHKRIRCAFDEESSDEDEGEDEDENDDEDG